MDYTIRRQILLKQLAKTNRALTFHLKEFKKKEIKRLKSNKQKITNFLLNN